MKPGSAPWKRLRSNTAIDTLVNNAGTAQMAPFLAGDVAQHQAINTLNTTALMRLTYAILPRLARNNRGTLINIASVLIAARPCGQRALQRHQGVGVELYPRTTGRICRQQRAHSGRAARRHGDGNLEPFGVTVNDLPEGSVMTTDDMVDASLAGLDQGEPITIPPMHDVSLWDRYEAARLELFNSARTGIPAPRYAKQ
jgi:short-subunit dehydrogenase